MDDDRGERLPPHASPPFWSRRWRSVAREDDGEEDEGDRGADPMLHQRKPCLYMKSATLSVAFIGPPSPPVMTYGSAKSWK